MKKIVFLILVLFGVAGCSVPLLKLQEREKVQVVETGVDARAAFSRARTHIASKTGYKLDNLALNEKEDLALIGHVSGTCHDGLYALRSEAQMDIRFKDQKMRLSFNNLTIYEINAYGQTLRTYGPENSEEVKLGFDCIGVDGFVDGLTVAVRGQSKEDNW